MRPDDARRTAFRAERPALVRAGLRTIIVLDLCLTPFFVTLTSARHTRLLVPSLVAHGADIAAQLGFLWLLLRPAGERRAWLVSLLGPAVSALTGTLLSTQVDDPHFVGGTFVILCTAILVPLPPVRMLLSCVVVSAITLLVVLHAAPAVATPAAIVGLLVAPTLIAVTCAVLTERLRWREFVSRSRLAEHARLLEAIRLAQSSFIAHDDPHALFGDLLDGILSVTRSRYGFIAEVVRDAGDAPVLRTYAVTSASWNAQTRRQSSAGPPGLRFEHLEALFGTAIATRTPVVVNDPAAELPHLDALALGLPPIDTFLGIPLFRGDQLVGLVGVANRTGGYDDTLVQSLAPLPDTVAGLVWAARHTREARSADEALQVQAQVSAALAHVGQTLIASLDTPVVLEHLCRVTAEVLGCTGSHTLLWQPAEDVYVPVAAAGVSSARVVQVPREILARLFRRFEQADVTEVPASPVQVFLEATAQEPMPPANRLCIALRRGHDVIGMQVASRSTDLPPFGPREHRIAQGIAQIASMALANAGLVEELARASRLKSEFVSTMSHELRTPLNVILGFAEMLQDPGASTNERTQGAVAIERAGRELLELIESTLEVGRIEAGRHQVHPQPVTLATLWHELEATCAMLPHAAGVTLTWSPAPPDVTLETDPLKLAIVIRNLVGNALKFTEHGWVRAELEVSADAVTVRVRDTGIGIAPADRETIFELFRQADGSTTRRYGGTGLGLYIARRFADLLGGTVTLDSTPGQGSTFTVTLPRARPMAASSRAA